MSKVVKLSKYKISHKRDAMHVITGVVLAAVVFVLAVTVVHAVS